MDKKMIVVVYVILRRGKGIVLLKEKDRPGWKLPGGWVEWGESFEETVKREVKEEIGVERIAIDKLVGIWQHFGDNDHRVVIVLSGMVEEKIDFRPNLDEIEEVEVIGMEEVRLREEKNFFKRRFYEPVQNYLDGKIWPIEMVQNFTRSQQ